MSSHEIDAAIRGAAGRGRMNVKPGMSESNRQMNDMFLRATGRALAEPHPADTIDEAIDDGFAREAKRLGVAPDLIDAARAVIPNAGELSGAVLRSALTKTIEQRPGLRTAEPRLGSEGLDGGVRSRNEPEESGSDQMTRLILERTGRIAPRAHRYPKGIISSE